METFRRKKPVQLVSSVGRSHWVTKQVRAEINARSIVCLSTYVKLAMPARAYEMTYFNVFSNYLGSF